MPKVMEIPAPITRRIIAFIADVLICDLVFFSPFTEVLESKLPKEFSAMQGVLEGNAALVSEVFMVLVAMCMIMLLYFALCEYKLGQTFGKILFNLYVEGVEEKPTFFQCILRSLFVIPVFPFILLWIIDPLYMAFSGHGVRLTERLSKTKTVGYMNLGI